MKLTHRPRRLRRTARLREMVAETSLAPTDLVMPLFVRPGKGERRPVASMPGVCQLSVDEAAAEAADVERVGVPAVILFGIPESKDAVGSEGYSDDGIVQQAVRAIKERVPELCVITDVCLCEYTDHGHCGVIGETAGRRDVANDPTVELLARMALSHARAGADIVAPSDMMDGRVGAIREALDGDGFSYVAILAYSVKFASAFYGPFRDAAESPPQFGDRRSYQMDFANGDEALREAELDLDEGADMIMVKPAMVYLDLVLRIKEALGVPVAVYNVSGEYAMVKAAAANGWIDEKAVVLETLTAFKRAGADLILTYFAEDAARWLADA